MPQAAVLNLAFLGLESLGAILAVVLGFGVLVFVHELGHFLAAKWVDVRVEVFSLGFGPRLFGFVRGTTDYRISALPLGGYVKMLGQDDADPNTPRTSSPDDFRNKSIGGRMLILVAGVVMNTIFAVIAFIVAFAVGVEFTAPEVGVVTPNSAASQARIVGAAPGERVGLAPLDQIVAINGSPIFAWEDVTTTIALSNGPVAIDVARPDSTTGALKHLTFEATPRREDNSPFPRLGIEFLQVVGELPEDSPAKAAGLKKDDILLDVAPVVTTTTNTARDLAKIDETIRNHPGDELEILVERRQYDQDGRPLEKPPSYPRVHAKATPRAFYDIGVTFADTVRVAGFQSNPSAKALLAVDDILVSIDGRAVTDQNIADVVRAAGEAHHAPEATKSDPVKVVFKRRNPDKGSAWEQKEGLVTLDRRANDEGWFLGVEYVDDQVASVEAGSPAALVGIEAGDFITKVQTETFLGLKYRSSVRVKKQRIEEVANEKKEEPWKIFWEKDQTGVERSAEIRARKTNKLFGDLGIALAPRGIIVRRGILGACSLGVDRTIRMFQQLVLTLRGLFARSVSTKELGGPIQIATITYKIANSNGLGKLFYFLAILSVNLAVLNILPIPVLDGGHIFLLTLEKLKGRPLSDDVMRYVQYAGFLFVIGLMVYVTFNDIRRVFE